VPYGAWLGSLVGSKSSRAPAKIASAISYSPLLSPFSSIARLIRVLLLDSRLRLYRIGNAGGRPLSDRFHRFRRFE